MKKRAFKDGVYEIWRSNETAPAVLNEIANLAERAGVQWDPEEAELPERVWVDDCILVPEGRTSLDTSLGENEANALEAAARYNAVGRLLGWSEEAAHGIRGLLRSEREKLRRSHE